MLFSSFLNTASMIWFHTIPIIHYKHLIFGSLQAALLKAWRKPFTESEIKCLTQQLLSAVEFCHRNWVVHR